MMQTPQYGEHKLPENYLAAMAATTVLAKKWEAEMPDYINTS